MRVGLLGAGASLVIGMALIVVSIVEGSANVSLIIIIPIISGSSFVFLLGVILLVVGFFGLAFALADGSEELPPPAPGGAPSSSRTQGGAGGIVLIGPVPIVFGTWKGISRRTQQCLVLAGAVLFIFALIAFVLFVR